jgi:hypothetical protein
MSTPYWLKIKESKPIKESKVNEDNYDRHRISGMWWSGEGMHKGISSNSGFLDFPFLTDEQRRKLHGAVLQLKKSTNPNVQYDCFLLIPKKKNQTTEQKMDAMQFQLFKQREAIRALESSVAKMMQTVQAVCENETDDTKGEQPNV